MLRYWQKSISGQESYCECEASRATYFSVNGGDFRPISELTNNIPVENINDDDAAPLEMPVMNFGNEETTDTDGPLVAPSLF